MIPMPATWCMYYRGITPAPEELLDLNIISEEYRMRPHFAYPMGRGELRRFTDVRSWYDYVQGLRIQPGKVLLPYIDAFDEGLRALFMTYVLPEFCKLGEMKVLATLEGAALVAYKHAMCVDKDSGHRCAMLRQILDWAHKNDGLPVEWFKQEVSGKSRSDLNVIRNKQMHGELLEETFPWGGLFENAKRILEYVYWNREPYDVHKERLILANGHVSTTRMDSDLDYVPSYAPIE